MSTPRKRMSMKGLHSPYVSPRTKAAAELIESNSSFALRIQTSEPVLVSIAKAHGHGATSAVGMQLLRDRRDWSPTEASAAVLAPYIFGKLGLHEEPPDPFGRDSS